MFLFFSKKSKIYSQSLALLSGFLLAIHILNIPTMPVYFSNPMCMCAAASGFKALSVYIYI